MPLQRLTPPSKPAITAAFVKQHTRIDIDADDSYLENLLIPAAIDLAEMYLRRSLITQTWQKTLDMFPGPSLIGVPWGQAFTIPEHAIILEKPPILSITSVNFVGLDGSQNSLTAYNPRSGLPVPSGGTFSYVDLTAAGTIRVDDLLRITPPFGQVWPPNVLPEIGSVWVIYQAGYGPDQSYVPAAIKQWIAMNVATLYENRERCVVGTRVTVSELPYVDRMMDAYVVELN